MKPLIKTAALIYLFSVLVSCNRNPTEPEPQPGRRDYVWTVDTLIIPFTYLQGIAGSGPDDVWAVGPGGDLDKTIYHYDGVKWKNDGVPRIISPLSVCSFSKNNVWLGGREGHIWHYDGISWKENIWFKKTNWDIGFQAIWGDTPGEIYATGYADSSDVWKGIILRFNGYNWVEQKIPFLTYNFLRIRRGINESTKYYLLGSGVIGTDTDALFEFDGQKIKSIYEAKYSPSTWMTIQSIGSKMYFVTGNKINKYINNQLIPIAQINDSMFGCQIFGRSENDIFLKMLNGIAHYNGNDVQYLYNFPYRAYSISDAVVFEKDVFFLANDFNNGLNLIFHGQLK
jgi:hypothetical protein